MMLISGIGNFHEPVRYGRILIVKEHQEPQSRGLRLRIFLMLTPRMPGQDVQLID